MTEERSDQETEGATALPVSETPAPPARSGALFPTLLVALNIVMLGALGFVLWTGGSAQNGEEEAHATQIDALRARLGTLEAVSARSAAADTALQSRIGAVEAEVAALPKTASAAEGASPDQAAGIAALEKRVDALAQGLDPLAGRIAALEQRPEPDEAPLAALAERVAALEQARLTAAAEAARRMDSLEAALTEQVRPALAGLAQSAPQHASKAELQSVIARLERVEGADDKRLVHAAAAALAVAVLADAVASGLPYAEELAAVSRLAAPSITASPVLDTLGRQAATGIPTQQALIADFPAAARAARAAASPRDEGMAGTIRRIFGGLVTIRTPGAATESALDAMERALGRDDLSQTLAAAKDLEPKSRAALEPWLARARLRQSGLSAVTALRRAAVRDLAATATQ